VKLDGSVRAMVFAAALPALWLADFPAGDPLGIGLGREAAAVVGAPLSPVSVAGVARRSTRRAVVAQGAAAQSSTAATAQQQSATAQQQAAVAQQQAGTPAAGTVVTTLPSGCVQETKGGTAYQKCGSVYYRAAFQGNNLVYVVQ
jgi:hypothetical protein